MTFKAVGKIFFAMVLLAMVELLVRLVIDKVNPEGVTGMTGAELITPSQKLKIIKGEPDFFLQHAGRMSGKLVEYRYPALFKTLRSTSIEPSFIIGILSTAENKKRRNIIRDTWGKSHNVFFLVAGEWDDVKNEFDMHGDLLWVKLQESFTGIAYKTEALMYAVSRHLQKFSYVLKVDDDSYVKVSEIQRVVEAANRDYLGFCLYKTRPVREPVDDPNYVSKETYPQDHYPPFAFGAAFAMSKPFINCATEKMKDAQYIPHEGAAIGILAERCAVECTMNKGMVPWKSENSTRTGNELLYHYLSDEEIVSFHKSNGEASRDQSRL